VENVGVKLLLDQHLSRGLIARLDASFTGTTLVAVHGLETSDDNAVWEFASAGGFVIATKY